MTGANYLTTRVLVASLTFLLLLTIRINLAALRTFVALLRKLALIVVLLDGLMSVMRSEILT